MTLPALGSVHHVGIACRDLESARAWVLATFSVSFDSGPVHDPLQDADLSLLQINHGFALELVSGPIVQDMLRRKNTYYHLCYQVGDISESISSLESGGCRLISGPVPAVLFGGRPVRVLIEPARPHGVAGGVVKIVVLSNTTMQPLRSHLSDCQIHFSGVGDLSIWLADPHSPAADPDTDVLMVHADGDTLLPPLGDPGAAEALLSLLESFIKNHPLTQIVVTTLLPEPRSAVFVRRRG